MVNYADPENPGSFSELVLDAQVVVAGPNVAAGVIVRKDHRGSGFWGNVTSGLGMGAGFGVANMLIGGIFNAL